MRVVYAGEGAPRSLKKKSVFLAGPTPRSEMVQSWRPEALRLFERFNFNGVVLVPEWRGGFRTEIIYEDRVKWEDRMLHAATCILFWIPRRIDTMPAFTTNVEFGEWMKSGKVVLGSPEWAEKMTYLRFKAEKYSIPHYSTLEVTIRGALLKIEQEG